MEDRKVAFDLTKDKFTPNSTQLTEVSVLDGPHQVAHLAAAHFPEGVSLTELNAKFRE